MLLLHRKNGLASLFKEVRVFRENGRKKFHQKSSMEKSKTLDVFHTAPNKVLSLLRLWVLGGPMHVGVWGALEGLHFHNPTSSF